MFFSLVIKNCGQLLTMKGLAPKKGKEMSQLGILKNAYIACDGNKIFSVGLMKDFSKLKISRKTKVVDAEGNVVMPGLIDCHTHLVFAGNRAHELSLKLAGNSYLDILKSEGGILYTVKQTRKASKNELIDSGMEYLKDFLNYGVTTVEIKSGYGLDEKTELKILDVAENLKKKQPIRIVKTFLGAHTIPPNFKGDAQKYLNFLIEKVLPKVRAEFVDVFCENGAFDLIQSKKYLEGAARLGFKIKIHGEQLSRSAACRMAAELGAVSVDHCDHLSKSDMKFLAKKSTVAVLLPIVPLYTREEIYADGRAMIDSGMAVAVSTDFNPGSAPCRNIFLAMNLACLKMGLTVEEVLNAVTINAAYALDLGNEIGSIEAGKIADIAITSVKDYRELVYWMGGNVVQNVVCEGRVV